MALSKSVFVISAGLLAAQTATAAPSYPIVVHGGDETSFDPTLTDQSVIQDPGKYDAVIVGGGLGGLSAGVYLTDQGKHVLLLEKEAELGGLALGGTLPGSKIRYDRGAAYWTDTYEEEQKILDHIGLGRYQTQYPIHEPIDSYFWNGKLYEGIWDDKTLEELPASFALFRQELQEADKAHKIPNQPIEDDASLQNDATNLDQYDAANWIRRMPTDAATRTDAASRKLYDRFLSDPKVNRADPMGDVVQLMDLYCRSALGTNADQISAVAFANFYISEIVTRYTTNIGTAGAAELMAKILRQRPHHITISLNTPVVKLKNEPNDVAVTYIKNGHYHLAHAAYGVFAAELHFAPKIIEGIAERSPERVALINQMAYSHYAVHDVLVKGHPYRASYDTWLRPADYTEEEPTDVILGRWMDPAINGYQGLRDFRHNPADDKGILTIYHPLKLDWVGRGFTQDQAIGLAEGAVERVKQLFDPMLQAKWGTHIDVVSVETNRWPFSVHVARPGHFKNEVPTLRKPDERIYFANNNLGTPAFEEALFRGHCAADNVLARLNPHFKKETWSRCALEK